MTAKISSSQLCDSQVNIKLNARQPSYHQVKCVTAKISSK